MKSKRWFLLISFIILAVACQPAETESIDKAVAVEADVEAIRDLMKQYDAAANASDLEAWIGFYIDDAVQMPPQSSITIGKEAIHSNAEEYFSANTGQLSSIVEDVQVSGDLAYLRVSYTASMTPKEGGDTNTEIGKWVLICQRQADGSWKIYSDIWNSDTPAEPTTEE